MSELVEVEGIMCQVKDHKKKSLVEVYQHNLRIETDKYIGEQTMTEKRKGYVAALEINIKIAPFVLGWLVRPSEDEYRVITGRMTLDEFNKKYNSKPKKESSSQKPKEKSVKSKTKKT